MTEGCGVIFTLVVLILGNRVFLITNHKLTAYNVTHCLFSILMMGTNLIIQSMTLVCSSNYTMNEFNYLVPFWFTHH